MENITSVVELKNAIQILEEEQAVKGQILKKQALTTYESFKPAKIITSTLKGLALTPTLVDLIIGAAIGPTSGYLTKRLITGASGNVIRKLAGSVLELGVTSFVSKNSDSILTFGRNVLQRFLRKKERVPHKRKAG